MKERLTREQIVAAARAWIGTPFEHQGRLKGAGVDCAGLVIGVARELGLSDYDIDGYSRSADPAMMRAELERNLDEIAAGEIQPGDILWFRIEGDPRHLALVTALEPLTIIHAFDMKGVRACVEHVAAHWRRRVVAAYRYRGLA